MSEPLSYVAVQVAVVKSPSGQMIGLISKA